MDLGNNPYTFDITAPATMIFSSAAIRFPPMLARQRSLGIQWNWPSFIIPEGMNRVHEIFRREVGRPFASELTWERALFAAQKSFFDNSKARLLCKSKTRPSGSNSWICGRYASLRIANEKILIRAPSFLFRFLGKKSCKTFRELSSK